MKKSEYRARSLRWLANTGANHSAIGKSMRWPWLVSSGNTTPYWDSGLLSTLTSTTWTSVPADAKKMNHAFGVWFKCLSPFATTGEQPLFALMAGSGVVISASMTAEKTITFQYAEYTEPLYIGGTLTSSQTITVADRSFDDGEWHFVGYALKGGTTVANANEIRLIADHWYRDYSGVLDAIGTVISTSGKIRLGRVGAVYSEHLELAEPTFYLGATGADVSQLANHWQFGPLQGADTQTLYGNSIICQWLMEPAFISAGTWRGTKGMDMAWNGAAGFQTTVQNTWYRDTIIGGLYDRSINYPHPKSWAGNMGHEMKFASSNLISGWTGNITQRLPGSATYSYVITSGTWLDIPSNQKATWMNNTELARSANLIKRNT